jgi:hypothetical protein
LPSFDVGTCQESIDQVDFAPEARLSRHPENNVRERERCAVFDSVQVGSPVIVDPVRINGTLSLGYDKRGRSVG